MPFELPPLPPKAPTALLFPGQGAQCASMLDPFREAPRFVSHYTAVCHLLNEDPLREAQRHPESLNRNAVSSLLTVLAGVLALELLRERSPELTPAAAGGYSVGQWTALHAAGALSAEEVFRIVHHRAGIMDRCIEAAGPGGMMAVIGVKFQDVLSVCEQAAAENLLLQITNDNAPGQVTVGGTEQGLLYAEERLRAMSPKRLQRVPTAGAWHSSLLEPAAPKLAEYLAGVVMHPMQVPVIDNTTGDWLPPGGASLRASLARQVASPVLWQQGVRTMASFGIKNFVETGYGEVLTKFGFFIDRSVRHIACAPPPRGAA